MTARPAARRALATATSLSAAVRAIIVAVLIAVAACGPTTQSTSPATAQPTLSSSTASPGSAEPPPTEEPIETPDASAGTPPCALADLKASHGLVEGAAGSLLTEVLLVSAETCSVDASPTFVLRDADGEELVRATGPGPGAIDLVTSVAYTSQVQLGNWCLPEPAFPLALGIAMPGGELPVSGTGFVEEDGLPPCNSGDGPPMLDGSVWNPSP